LFGFLYQLFRDVVVDPRLELPIPPREPFQEALGSTEIELDRSTFVKSIWESWNFQ
jgi:hypothetical protein